MSYLDKSADPLTIARASHALAIRWRDAPSRTPEDRAHREGIRQALLVVRAMRRPGF